MKYIITDEQLRHITAVFDSIDASEDWMKALKPIEPLTPAEIKSMSRKHPSEDLCRWSYDMGVSDAERHIGIPE